MNRPILGLLLVSLLRIAVAHAQSNGALVTSLPAENESQAKGDRAYSGELKLTTSGRQFSDDVAQARYGRSTLGFKAKSDFEPWLVGNFGATQYLTSGTSSNLYGTTEVGATFNALLVEEASLSLMPVRETVFSAGILRINNNPVSSIFFEGDWPGIAADLHKDLGDFTVGVLGSQSVPASTVTSNRVVDQDTLPMFTTASLQSAYRFGESGVTLSAAATHFVFTDPNSGMAQDSQKIGSTVIGNGKGNYDFVYDYRGMEYAVKLAKVWKSESEVSLEASALRNELAPAGQNSGGQVKLKGKYARDRWNVIGDVTQFRAEADCLPAMAGPLIYGFTNRQGTAYQLKVEHKKTGLALFGAYTRANLVDNTTVGAQYQADRDITIIGAEVKYGLF